MALDTHSALSCMCVRVSQADGLQDVKMLVESEIVILSICVRFRIKMWQMILGPVTHADGPW